MSALLLGDEWGSSYWVLAALLCQQVPSCPTFTPPLYKHFFQSYIRLNLPMNVNYVLERIWICIIRCEISSWICFSDLILEPKPTDNVVGRATWFTVRSSPEGGKGANPLTHPLLTLFASTVGALLTQIQTLNSEIAFLKWMHLSEG